MCQQKKAGGPYQIAIICRNDTVTFKDVLLGEVWICSGQSNMQLSAEFKLPLMLDVLHWEHPILALDLN